MKFAEILKNTVLDPKSFPIVYELETTLFDGDGNRLENAEYTEDLFAENIESAISFYSFVSFLEHKTNASRIEVTIDEFFVLIDIDNNQHLEFKRTPPRNPYDFME